MGSRHRTMIRRTALIWAGHLFFSAVFSTLASPTVHADNENLIVRPSSIELSSGFDAVQLLVTQAEDSGAVTSRRSDLTPLASFQSSDDQVVRVDEHGLVESVGSGHAYVIVRVAAEEVSIPVVVADHASQFQASFQRDVLPVLFKAGCNSGACHASQYGKGGFTLSVMSFDPIADYNAITKSARGRRIAPASPDASLLLRKPTMDVPHGGGKRLEPDSIHYHILRSWIAQGATAPVPDEPKVTRLRVEPTDRLGMVGERQQLRVLADYNDGAERDVTAWARFDSLDEGVVTVSDRGLVTAIGSGQAPVMVRFSGQASLCTFVVPYQSPPPDIDWTSDNPLDKHAATKFVELGIPPSPICDDATFLRRAFLDAIGGLPTPEEAVAFLDSTDADKRVKLIDRLLGMTGDPSQDVYNDRYAAYWSLKWADLLRNNSANLGESGMWALHNWLRESFRVNKPFDHFVRELVTAKGSSFNVGPANYYRINNNPSDLAEATAQLFLGTRLQCAKCHHHPYEKYGQQDYYQFAAFFARVGTKSSSEFGVFGGETVVVARSGGEVYHPKTGALMKPTAIDSQPIEDVGDRRIKLADWLTSTDNQYFAENLVNRYMAYLLGRGLVDPVDDLRSTNPPSNIPMMSALASEFRESGFDIKKLIRTIMTSRLYQLDSQPNVPNAADRRFYSHYQVKRIPAEALLDCIDAATGSTTKHPNLPLGTRATELPDAMTTNDFLNVFGKPKRVSVCECERAPDENLAQALHVLNGDIVANKIADGNGRVAKMLSQDLSDEERIDHLYLATLCRRATEQERNFALALIKELPSPHEAYQDLLWALINSKQFLFVR